MLKLVLVAPYRAILRYYRCDTLYREMLFQGGKQLLKMVRYRPLGIYFFTGTCVRYPILQYIAR